MWIGKGAEVVADYVKQCEAGAKWRDLGRVYRWQWGESLRLPDCSVQRKGRTGNEFHEPVWRP
ncbi:hypothetical protein BDZ91DRAFT_729343 [Kalaharituber pfeilii]|nr:hypothetical protein BDZ91DRAFT_729343 [Kalaharituber pfeilii]